MESKVEQNCYLIKTATQFSEVIQILNDLLDIDKIEVVFTEDAEVISLCIKEYTVSRIIDPKIPFLPGYLNDISKHIYAYQYFLETILDSDSLDYKEKRFQVQNAYSFFIEKSKQYDVSSRFSFIQRSLFYTKIEGKAHDVLYECMHIDEALHEQLRELFKIRSEAYEKLAIETNRLINWLENNYKINSIIQLTEAGEKLFSEIIIGLQIDETFVKNKDKNAFQTKMCEFLGLDRRVFSINKDNLKKKQNKAAYIEKLEEKLNYPVQK